jgi:glycosyltransferase involved in cell wall biosynthesis
MKYSIIVPVFNRPDEVDELLESLCHQEVKDFEVIIVEDGSKKPCKDVCDKYAGILDLHYYYKDNSGPGQSRNYGAERAQGDWLIVLDSDVVLPQGYLSSVECRVQSVEFPTGLQSSSESMAVAARPLDACYQRDARNSKLYTLNSQLAAWGGPDASHPSFTPVQKAISYSMTSFFTTGGIRGGKGKKLDKFFPRSFNMGIRREVYQQLGGFSKMRFGEDIDFSYRIVEAGYQTALIPEAWVWHKRRTDFRKFFRQVYNSGIARINLEKRHPGTLKLVHLLPTVFTLGVLGCLLLFVLGAGLYIEGEWLDANGMRPHDNMHQGIGFALSVLSLLPLLFYSSVIFLDSSIKNKSLWVGMLSIPAAFVQLMGYGFGFIESWWKRCILKQDEFTAFEKNFYK